MSRRGEAFVRRQSLSSGTLKEFPNRMKRLIVLPVLLGAGMAVAQMPATPGVPSAPEPAGAAPVHAAGPTKLAVVAFQIAVSQTNEFQRDFADLQKKYMPKREQLKTLSDQIDNLTKQLQAQASTLSDAQRADRARDIDDKKNQLQRSAKDDESDYQGEVQQLFASTAQKVYDVLANYAQQHGYTVVLDVGSQQSPIMYAPASANITKQVVDAYNVKSGVPAPPSPAAATPSAPATHPRPSTAPKGPGR